MEKRNAAGLTEKEFLEAYKPGDYERPSVTVDMLIVGIDESLSRLKVLLIQRNNHPFIDCWALAGGFVNMDESAYQAAGRELYEETGLEDVYMEQLYTMSQPSRDPRTRVISIAYMALMPVAAVHAGDDAKDALWFDVEFNDRQLILSNDERNIRMEYSIRKKKFKNGVITVKNYTSELISEEALAFDHVEIILEGLMRLRNKVEYSDIAFNMVPEEFTLPDLQRVFETILGKKLYKSNFREKIAGKVVELDRKGVSISGKRSSFLYRYKS